MMCKISHKKRNVISNERKSGTIKCSLQIDVCLFTFSYSCLQYHANCIMDNISAINLNFSEFHDSTIILYADNR